MTPAEQSDTPSSSEQEVDVVVVGTGPGGESLAGALARAGLEVVAVERHLVGGECPYYGCIPSKIVVRAADALAEARRVDRVAGHAEVRPDYAAVARRIDEEATTGWDDTAAVDRLEDAGGRLVRGHGRLAGPGLVEVATADGVLRLRARRGVVVNTGTRPAVPPVPGLADTPFWTNRDILRQRTLPASLIVVGGGPIGCELAQAWSRFGVEVTILEVGPRILGPVEPEASQVLAEVLADEGVQVRAGVRLERVDHDGESFTLTLGGDEAERNGATVRAQALLVAAGRTPNLDDLGLETVGLDPGARTLRVDDRQRVLGEEGPIAGLWAVGDVTGRGAFTHVSMYQAEIARRTILDEDGEPAAYHALPHVTFTDPEVGGVGLTEHQARERGIDVAVGVTPLSSSSRGFTHGPGAEGLIKVVVDRAAGVLVGATAVGPGGGEVLGLLALAVHARVPLTTLRTMIYAYPTFHRAIETALAEVD